MENELVVRLVECAKPLNSVYDSNDPTQVLVTGWADTTTVPKRGEICLEYYTNTDSSSENYGKICYRMKIGDGIHKYIESDPDNSLPYFPLSDDVINLIVSWVNTHLNVNEYAQASYDNTNHTLKVYSISEQYGKIGHLADGTATPSLDVEVTFAAGTKINLASVDNTLTITHEATTRSDTGNTTNLAFEDNVVTGVTTDATGHITGITTYKLPANPVSAASGTTNQIMISDGDNTTSTSGVTITTTAPSSSSDDTTVPTSKAVNDSIDTKINALDSSVSAGSGKVLTGVTEADGKLTGKTDVDYTTIAPVQSVAGDNKWTSVSTSNNTATVSHIGPDTSSTSSATATAGTAPGFGGNVLTGVTIDGKGHVTGVTTGALPSNPVSSLEGSATDTDSGITVAVESTGGEVDGVNVIVALDTLKSALGLAGAMIMKGTIGTGGTITTLPTASSGNLGWTYKVITDNVGITGSKVGDLIVCRAIGTTPETYEWIIIPSGDESFTDTWRNIKVNGTEKLGTGISSGALNIVDGSHSSANWNGTNKTLQIDIDEASTSQKGVVELTDSYTSTDDTEAATGKSIKAALETLDVSATSIGGNEHITSISETDGKISVSKDTIQSASTTQSGITQYVEDIHYSRDTAKTANAKQIWDECEKRNVQFVKSGIIPVPQPYNEETFINNFAYGIKWRHDTSTVYSVGNSEYIRTQPIHNSLRACVYKINYVSGGFDVTETVGGTSYTIHYGARREFLYWLDDNNWSKKTDGTASVLDGTGDTGIAIYHPAFYGKSFTKVEDGHTWHYVYISPMKYDDTWDTIKEGYTDFAKASIVDSKARCYTGATPGVSMPRMLMNDYALASGGHQMSYDEYKWLFYWLPVIDFKTFEIESNDTPSTWSWGSDVVDRDSLTGSSIPSYGYPMLYSGGTLGYNYVTSGYTNALGTHTGWVKYTNESYTANALPIVRWRGFEIQRCNWTNVQGCWGEQTDNVDTIFATKNRALFSAYKNPNGYYSPYGEWGCITDLSGNELAVDSQISNETWTLDTTDGLWKSTSYKTKDKNIRYVGKQVGGWINEFALNSYGDIVPVETTYTKYDYSYTYNGMTPDYYNNPRYLIFGERAHYGSTGGPGCLSSYYAASSASVDIAFRVCWNIDEYTSVMN